MKDETATEKIFHITYTVEGRYTTTVKASGLKEAKKLAEEAFTEADFGELADIEGEFLYAEDENYNRS